MGHFAETVYAIVAKIPKGKVCTYSQVANALGNPRAARAVGNALNKNRNFDKVPCHRVVRSDGHLGGYVRGDAWKIKLLETEGIEVGHGYIDLERYRFQL